MDFDNKFLNRSKLLFLSEGMSGRKAGRRENPGPLFYLIFHSAPLLPPPPLDLFCSSPAEETRPTAQVIGISTPHYRVRLARIIALDAWSSIRIW